MFVADLAPTTHQNGSLAFTDLNLPAVDYDPCRLAGRLVELKGTAGAQSCHIH
jgi:hypothetical protein